MQEVTFRGTTAQQVEPIILWPPLGVIFILNSLGIIVYIEYLLLTNQIHSIMMG